MTENLNYKIALSLLPNIGDILTKRLVGYCGSAEAVFKEKPAALLKIPGIGSSHITTILNREVLTFAEHEITFIEKNNILPLYYLDEDYPKRLIHCEDSPTMIYYKGNSNLNARKIISIVGTRNATHYGKRLCEKLIADLSSFNPIIVSGLAYGIDICAHRAALENGLNTIGVFAHGLDKVYPSAHSQTAEKMMEQGGLVSDFISNTTSARRLRE